MSLYIEHLVLISSSFPDENEGLSAAGSFVYDFAEELSKHTKITVIAPSKQSKKVHLSKNLSIVYFRCKKLPLSNLSLSKPGDLYHIILTMINGWACVNKISRKSNIDHIFSLWILPSGLWSFINKKLNKIPYSCWALGSDIWDYKGSSLSKYILKLIMNNSDFVFADGYNLIHDVQSLSSKKCHFLPSIRNLDQYSNHEKNTLPKSCLAYLGRWHKNKGVDLLLEALNLLKDEHWKKISEITIAGGGPLDLLVFEKCQKLQSENRPIKLKGFLNKTQASEFIARADYLIIPSRIESIPVVLSDAIQLNTPIIATPAGDIPELLNRYNLGILSTSFKPHDIALAIIEAINTPSESFQKGFHEASVFFNYKTQVKKLLEKLNSDNH